MTVLSQKEAVFQAITKVLNEADVTFDGSTAAKDIMTKEHRAQVNQILFDSFRSGAIILDCEKNDKELKAYVSGLQTNWLNKDKRLNGNVIFATKNPGSRAGSGDAQLKALRALLSRTENESEKAEIQGYIDDRLSKLEEEKKKTKKAVAIDFSALPEELQNKYA
jgi:hypothetical protein